MFSVGVDTGVVELLQYDPEIDPKFIELTVNAVDNLGIDPSLASSVAVKVRTYMKTQHTYAYSPCNIHRHSTRMHTVTHTAHNMHTHQCAQTLHSMHTHPTCSLIVCDICSKQF